MIIRNRFIPFKGFNAINLFGVILVKKHVHVSESLLNHERIHTRQILELFVVGFYLWYLVEWLIRLSQEGNAYRKISLEREAYIHEGDLQYLQHRKPYAWWSYL
jgi:hypothetical protein